MIPCSWLHDTPSCYQTGRPTKTTTNITYVWLWLSPGSLNSKNTARRERKPRSYFTDRGLRRTDTGTCQTLTLTTHKADYGQGRTWLISQLAGGSHELPASCIRATKRWALSHNNFTTCTRLPVLWIRSTAVWSLITMAIFNNIYKSHCRLEHK